VPQVRRLRSFQFINPQGSATSAMFAEAAGPVEIAEAIAREAGGNNWPMKIDGQDVHEFDFAGAREKVYDITWAPSKDMAYYKKQLQRSLDSVAQAGAGGHGPQPNSPRTRTQPSSASDALVATFTESRAAAVEAEFGQLIVACLDTMEETIDTLIAKKIELLKEKARIEATILVLEQRIDGFKQKADGIIELVDPYEQDIAKLGGGRDFAE
jgi:hypothetical protein